MILRFSREIYSKDAILKASYYFTEKAYLHIDIDDKCYIINITPKEDFLDYPFEQHFENKLIEYMNRLIVSESTGRLRDIIMARALASTVIYDGDNISLSEPPAEDESAEKDWFNAE